MIRRRTLTPVLAALFVALVTHQSVVAQATRAPERGLVLERRIQPDAFDLSRLLGVSKHGDRVRAIGSNFAAEFDAAGWTFAMAPHERDAEPTALRFELESIRLGDTLLAGVTLGPVEPDLVDSTILYPRGSVLERYEVRQNGIEQSFVIHERPEQTVGDLVIRGRLTTDLMPARRGRIDGTDGFEMATGDGRAGVRIGGVTAIAADGRRTAGYLRVGEQSIELVVAGDFVTNAAFPLVVDPLIGPSTTISVGSGVSTLGVDCAYDAQHDVYLVAAARHFVFAKAVVVQRFEGATLAPIGTGEILDSVPTIHGDIQSLAVAAVVPAERFLVAWSSKKSIYAGGTGTWDVVCCDVHAGLGDISALRSVAATSADEVDVDVGGELEIGNSGIVVWDDQAVGIRCRTVTMSVAPTSPWWSTAPTVGPMITVHGGAGTDVDAPRITESGGIAGRHVVIYEDNRNSGAIIGRGVNRDGSFFSYPANIAIDHTIREGMPDVAGDGDSWMAIWSESESGTAGPNDTACRRLGLDSLGRLVALGPKLVVGGHAGVDEVEPAIAFLGPKYVAVWGHGTEVRGLALGVDNCEACGLPFAVDRDAGDRDYVPGVASKWAGGSDNDDALISWLRGLAAASGFQVEAQVFSAIGDGGDIVAMRNSCLQGSIRVQGPFALANTARISITSTPPGTTHVRLLVGDGTSGLSYFRGCTLVNPIWTGPVLPLVSGMVTSDFDIGCDPSTLGAHFHFQWELIRSGGHAGVMTTGYSNVIRAFVGL